MELFTKTFSCTTFYGGKTLVFGPILPFQLFVGPISTKSWAQLFVEPAVNKKLKVGRAGGWRAAVERAEWQSDRFRCKFLSDLFICLFWNIWYCRSYVFRKYEADFPIWSTVQVWDSIFLGISFLNLNRSTWFFFSYFPYQNFFWLHIFNQTFVRSEDLGYSVVLLPRAASTLLDLHSTLEKRLRSQIN